MKTREYLSVRLSARAQSGKALTAQAMEPAPETRSGKASAARAALPKAAWLANDLCSWWRGARGPAVALAQSFLYCELMLPRRCTCWACDNSVTYLETPSAFFLAGHGGARACGKREAAKFRVEDRPGLVCMSQTFPAEDQQADCCATSHKDIESELICYSYRFPSALCP